MLSELHQRNTVRKNVIYEPFLQGKLLRTSFCGGGTLAGQQTNARATELQHTANIRTVYSVLISQKIRTVQRARFRKSEGC